MQIMTTNKPPVFIRVFPATKEALDKAAAEAPCSVSNLVERVMTAWLRENGYLPKPKGKKPLT